MSSDLRRELEELRQQLEELQPSHQAEDYLRARFAAPDFDDHRERIVAALLSPTAHYSFSVQLAEDPDDCPSRFMLYWPDRSQPVVCIHVQRVTNWRGLQYALLPAATSTLDDTPTTSYTPQSYEDAPAAPSESRPTSAQGHAEQPTESPTGDVKDVDVAAQIAAIQARIAQLTAAEQRQEQQPTSPAPAQIAQPSGANAIDWARRLF